MTRYGATTIATTIDGVTGWTLTKNKIITRALRMIGVVAQGDSPYPEQLVEAGEALNGFLKSFNIGTKLWQVRWYSKVLETTTTNIVGTDGYIYDCIRGHASTVDNKPITGSEYQAYWKQTDTSFDAWVTGTVYSIGDQVYAQDANSLYKVYTATADHTAGATFLGDIANWDIDTTYNAWTDTTSYANIGDLLLPSNTLEVIDIWYKDILNSDRTDTPIKLISGDKFMQIWDKEDTDTYPDYAWVDKQRNNRLYLRKIPNDKTSFELFIRAEEVIDDLIDPGQNPDMYSMYYDMITYGLAVRLCPEYNIKTQEKNDLKAELVELVNIYKQRNKEDVDEERIEPAF